MVWDTPVGKGLGRAVRSGAAQPNKMEHLWRLLQITWSGKFSLRR